jgi:hypothetical protein
MHEVRAYSDVGQLRPYSRLLPELTMEQRANPGGLQATHAQDSSLPNLQNFSLLQGYPYSRTVTGQNRRGAG